MCFNLIRFPFIAGMNCLFRESFSVFVFPFVRMFESILLHAACQLKNVMKSTIGNKKTCRKMSHWPQIAPILSICMKAKHQSIKAKTLLLFCIAEKIERERFRNHYEKMS
jgi:hypothetical protein